MPKIIILLPFILVNLAVSAQTTPFAISNDGGLNLNIATDTCFSGTAITSLSPGQKLVSSETLMSNCGIWQRVSIPSITQHADTFGYICGGLSALCDIVPDLFAPFVQVHNTDTIGLFVRPAPVAGHVTINGSNAKIWDGQKFAVTGNTQTVGGAFWREIYLTDNCSQLTGWVSDTFLNYVTGLANDELNNTLELSVFPNPAFEYILISFNHSLTKDYKVEVLNVKGKLIESYLNKKYIDVSKLEAGVYLLRVKQELNSAIQRFVKN